MTIRTAMVVTVAMVVAIIAVIVAAAVMIAAPIAAIIAVIATIATIAIVTMAITLVPTAAVIHRLRVHDATFINCTGLFINNSRRRIVNRRWRVINRRTEKDWKPQIDANQYAGVRLGEKARQCDNSKAERCYQHLDRLHLILLAGGLVVPCANNGTLVGRVDAVTVAGVPIPSQYAAKCTI